MGSHVVPALAKHFMGGFENKWLRDCPHGRRYIDDIFVLFSYLDHAEKTLFLSFLKKEKVDRLSFLRRHYFLLKRKICH